MKIKDFAQLKDKTIFTKPEMVNVGDKVYYVCRQTDTTQIGLVVQRYIDDEVFERKYCFRLKNGLQLRYSHFNVVPVVTPNKKSNVRK